jgi:hypothetical protein
MKLFAAHSACSPIGNGRSQAQGKADLLLKLLLQAIHIFSGRGFGKNPEGRGWIFGFGLYP